MKTAFLSLLLASSATAFAPSQQKNAATTSLSMAVEDLPGATKPFPGWDPMNLATLGSESTLAWFQAAELKHARVAMLATTGYLVQAAGVHWPGQLSSDVTFESLSVMKPFDAWAAMPEGGQGQILFTIGIAELISESNGIHYTKGGDLPTIIFPPINFSDVDEAELKLRRSRELNNGRLAMIAIMSFVAAANIPGSVPLLINNPMF
jgi:hypothetical protein